MCLGSIDHNVYKMAAESNSRFNSNEGFHLLYAPYCESIRCIFEIGVCLRFECGLWST